MFHVNRPLSPNSPWKWLSFKISRVNGISGSRLALYDLYETKNHNFYTKTSLLKKKAWVSPVLLPNWFHHFLAQNCGSKRGPLFWDPEKQFLSRNALLKLIRFEWMSFAWKIGCRSWSQKLSPHVSTQSLYKMFHVKRFELQFPWDQIVSKKAHVATFKEGTAFLGSDQGLRVMQMNLGPFKTEWKVLGPWLPEVLISAWYPLCQSKTKRARDVPC